MTRKESRRIRQPAAAASRSLSQGVPSKQVFAPTPLAMAVNAALARPAAMLLRHRKLVPALTLSLTLAAGETWPSPGENALLVFEDASSNQVMVFIYANTDIDDIAEPPWPQNIVGIASQYDPVGPYFDGYQVIPRDVSDLGGNLCSCTGANVQEFLCVGDGTQCQIAVCTADFDNCDTLVGTGCEADLLTDEDNCGQCGWVCDWDHTCEAGSCVPTCTLSPGFCDDDDACNGLETCNAATGCEAGPARTTSTAAAASTF